MKDALRAFVPTVIAARIESGVADLFVYENRKLVSVFMKARRARSHEIARDCARSERKLVSVFMKARATCQLPHNNRCSGLAARSFARCTTSKLATWRSPSCRRVRQSVRERSRCARKDGDGGAYTARNAARRLTSSRVHQPRGPRQPITHLQKATFLTLYGAQEKIRKYMGSVTRLITDDKGTRFLIAFGMPGQVRAVVVVMRCCCDGEMLLLCQAMDDDESRAVLLLW